MHRRIRSRSGFTLVELLVVIAVIALLLGLMLPAIGSFRARARASVSMSNLRQWGIGYSNFASDRKGLIPWEGLKDAKDMVTNLNDLQRYWANAVAPMVDQAPYADIAVDNASVPVPPQGSNIFIDPAAQPPVDGSGSFKGWLIPGTTKRFYFSYVPNSQLNNTLEAQMDAITDTSDLRATKNKLNPATNTIRPEWIDARRMRLSQIKKTAQTPLLLELRSVASELDGAGTVNDKVPQYWHPYYGETLNRHRGEWQRFGARHRNGGHLLMADGHVEWYDNNTACTPKGGSQPSAAKGKDFNRDDLTWDPLGPSYMD